MAEPLSTSLDDLRRWAAAEAMAARTPQELFLYAADGSVASLKTIPGRIERTGHGLRVVQPAWQLDVTDDAGTITRLRSDDADGTA